MKKIIKKVYLVFLISLQFCSFKSTIETSLKYYPADGISSGRIILTKSYNNKNEGLSGPFGDIDSIKIISQKNENNKIILFFKSTEIPGVVNFTSDSGNKLYLTFYKINGDIDGDGFPDSSELNTETDRTSFRKWFVRIAESQFLKRNYSWNKKERDCSGLIRYAYREALKKHDNRWHQKSGLVIDKNLGDIKKFYYPDVPIIKDRLFKINKGPAYDLETFGFFADADKLFSLNCAFVTKKINEALPGDLIFFHDKFNYKFPYHSMIVAGFEEDEIIIIYHTGVDDILKRVPLSYLKNSVSFFPEKWNRKFLGVYRFHILL